MGVQIVDSKGEMAMEASILNGICNILSGGWYVVSIRGVIKVCFQYDGSIELLQWDGVPISGDYTQVRACMLY